MTVIKLTVTNDNVLRRLSGKLALTTLSGIVIASALNGDTVVTSVKVAVFDEDAVT